MQTETIKKRFLSSKEVAMYLGVSESAIRKWIRFGTIPFNKINGCIRFNSEEIDKWAAAKS